MTPVRGLLAEKTLSLRYRLPTSYTQAKQPACGSWKVKVGEHLI